MHTFRNNSFLRLRSRISPLLLLWALQQALVLPGPIIQGNTCTRQFLDQLFKIIFARNWNVGVFVTIICSINYMWTGVPSVHILICEFIFDPTDKIYSFNFSIFCWQIEIKGINKCIWLERVLLMRLNPCLKMKFFQLANATPF